MSSFFFFNPINSNVKRKKEKIDDLLKWKFDLQIFIFLTDSVSHINIIFIIKNIAV